LKQSDRDAGIQKKTKKLPSRTRWIVLIFYATVMISAGFSILSSAILEGSGTVAALVILLLIVLIGIAFDVVGVAVTAAEERPLHSMAAKKIPGAKEAIGLMKNADRVASICNDVVGDICGIMSGATAAVIVGNIVADLGYGDSWLQIVISGAVAGLTIGGKAIGKTVAINSNTEIVLFAGKLINSFTGIFRKKRKNK